VSFSDWWYYHIPDWSPPVTAELTAFTFVSPPKALALGSWIKPCYALSKQYRAQDLKNGRIIAWCYRQGPGLSNPYIHIGVTGVGSEGHKFQAYGITGVWCATRLTWCHTYDEICQKLLQFRLEYLLAGVWTVIAEGYRTPLSDDINMCGIGSTPQSLASTYTWDDVTIESML
jgi:hypothetical protein